MKYVVIGASAAGVNGIKTLRHNDKDAEIVLIAPDEGIYSRCILHKFISGERSPESLSFVEERFIEKNNVTWIKDKASCIDKKNHQVKLENGKEAYYDKLLISAGSITSSPPIKNLDKAGNVIGLRTIDDARAIKANMAHAKHIAVIGAGLIGCDAISAVMGSGAEVSCYEFGKHILPIQLDKYSAGVYEEAFSKNGVKQHYGIMVSEVLLDDSGGIKALKLSDGTEHLCDMIIIASGVRANVEFLKDSGLELDKKGLIYDEYGRTSDENIYGAGDISGKSPIWPAAVKEGIIAAHNMGGIKTAMTDFFVSKSTMNFLGIPTMSIGLPEAPDDSFITITEADGKGNYKKIIHKDGQIKGAILQGDLSYAGILTQLIRENIDVTKVKKPLFKVDYSDFFGEFAF